MKGKFQNLVGRVFGELTVLRREGTSSPVMWRCLCACCGKESVTRAASLTQGLTKSCGQAENLAGKVFKNWTVISKAESSGYLTRWLCECVCGERQVIFAGNLKKGTAADCHRNRIERFGDAVIIWLERDNGNPLPCFIDATDYNLIKAYRWTAMSGYAVATVRGVRMHNLIFGSVEPGNEVDHEDNDGFNNRRCNLREATGRQQSLNRRKIGQYTSQFRGVVRLVNGGFTAAVSISKRKRMHLGTFANELDAARAYNEAAKRYYGEFAVTNELDDVSNIILDGVWMNGPLKGQKVNSTTEQLAELAASDIQQMPEQQKAELREHLKKELLSKWTQSK